MSLKKLLPTSLLGRTALIVLFPIVMFQLIILSYYYNSLWERTLNRLSRSVAMEIQLIAEPFIFNKEEKFDLEKIEEIFLIRYQIINESDYIETKSDINNLALKNFDKELKVRIKSPFTLTKDDSDNVKVLIKLKNEYLEILLPYSRITTSRNHIFFGWQIISSIILVLIAYLFLKNQVKPITNLAKAAEQFGKGQEVNDFKISGALEVRQAGKEFLKMKERISRQIEQRSLMLAGVSHDLKTPLTRMKLILESFKEQNIKDNLNEEIDQMNNMLVEYLDFAAINESENRSIVNPIEALKKIQNDIHFKGHNIKIVIVNDSSIEINENIFVRSITNVLNNAIKVSTEIKVVADITNELIKFSIHDNGPGIPDNEKLNVFKPFYRIDKSRNQNTFNSGLGLATTKALLSTINGNISLHDSYMGGLEVIIEIPN
ncbi:ATP-binding protein [Pelagibacteraceae bacterium]|nr:ATP-binding protein [Pelagibacteraceae bacterium]